MDFNLPEELQMLKDTVRKFVDKELIPIEMHSIENMELKPDIRERLENKTREMGLWMFDVPEEYGGGGLGSLAQVLVWEELSRTIALPSRGQGIFGPEVRPILYALDPEQKKIGSLTERERQIIVGVASHVGATARTIAETLHISEHTLRNHLTSIYDKLEVANRLELFAYAHKHNLTK